MEITVQLLTKFMTMNSEPQMCLPAYTALSCAADDGHDPVVRGDHSTLVLKFFKSQTYILLGISGPKGSGRASFCPSTARTASNSV